MNVKSSESKESEKQVNLCKFPRTEYCFNPGFIYHFNLDFYRVKLIMQWQFRTASENGFALFISFCVIFLRLMFYDCFNKNGAKDFIEIRLSLPLKTFARTEIF